MAPPTRFLGGLITTASVVAGAWLPESICDRIIIKDVAIIGGGASGSYAAVRLKEDFNKSIILIEKQGRIGGHVSTFDDPETSKPFDFGVNSFTDYGPAQAFFNRLGIPFSVPPRVALSTEYADFTTGLPVPGYTPPSNADRTAALVKFLNVTAPFENFILPGYWNFPSPSQIPEDLLLPFHEFVAKYNLTAAVPMVFQVTGMGVGDFQNSLTMHVLSAFGQPMLRAFLGQGVNFTPDSRRNIQLYEAIQSRLNSDILLNSVVVQSIRTTLGHTLWVKSSTTNTYTLVIARKLLISIPPIASNLAPFAIDSTEQSVFSKFRFPIVHCGIVTHPSLPVGGSITNTPASSAPDNYMSLPSLNFNSRYDWMGENSTNWRVLLVGRNTTFGTAEAQATVKADFARLRANGVVAAGGGELQIKAWANHGPMHAYVDVEEVRDGFYQKLYGLQGRRGTWWTGGAWSHQFQSVLWAFDDVLLPKIVA
ncbi:beta-cyclopiazonate dehydrogenase [Podospora fimiseda]|uniref:Beta-cyclopiazonate dehydrogenase n=1 Tax=Podospora fimiseda TaxID=252190 RepID=A0AAN7BG93_9PEZI|nr:beta-cyclopiazonate dehydrogenase [Podospora fimiseda]